MKTMSCTACGIESEACEKCPVCGTVAEKKFESPAMDKLTKKFTAFESFNEFAEAMSGGYVPSLYCTGKYRSKAKQMFVGAIRAAGFRVYDGRQVA
jgi:hypothetical protein